jgi:penicillin-binding protein 1A
MEKLYQDRDLGYKMGAFPKPVVKIRKNYHCVSPRIVAPIKVDSIATDLILEDLNTADSVPSGLQ